MLGLLRIERVDLVVVLEGVWTASCDASEGAMLPFCLADMGDLALPLAFFAILADYLAVVVAWEGKKDGEMQ